MFVLRKRSKPKTLSECVEHGPVVQELYSWAANVKKIGILACFVFIAYGFISGIVVAMVTGFWGFVSTFISELIYGLLIYASTWCIAVLLIALANIVYNTKITANVALLNCEQEMTEEAKGVKNSVMRDELAETREVVKKDYWVCANCKTKMHQSVKSCSKCGGNIKLF